MDKVKVKHNRELHRKRLEDIRKSGIYAKIIGLGSREMQNKGHEENGTIFFIPPYYDEAVPKEDIKINVEYQQLLYMRGIFDAYIKYDFQNKKFTDEEIRLVYNGIRKIKVARRYLPNVKRVYALYQGLDDKYVGRSIHLRCIEGDKMVGLKSQTPIKMVDRKKGGRFKYDDYDMPMEAIYNSIKKNMKDLKDKKSKAEVVEEFKDKLNSLDYKVLLWKMNQYIFHGDILECGEDIELAGALGIF